VWISVVAVDAIEVGADAIRECGGGGGGASSSKLCVKSGVDGRESATLTRYDHGDGMTPPAEEMRQSVNRS
jgi:hypothetical protein